MPLTKKFLFILQVRSKEMFLENIDFLVTLNLKYVGFWIRRKLLSVEDGECIQNINRTGWKSAVNISDYCSDVFPNVTANLLLLR